MGYDHWKTTDPRDAEPETSVRVVCKRCGGEGMLDVGSYYFPSHRCDACDGDGSIEEPMEPLEADDLDDWTGPVPETCCSDDDYEPFEPGGIF